MSGSVVAVAKVAGLAPDAAYGIAGGVALLVALAALFLGRRLGRRAIGQRLTALGTRLGIDPPEDDTRIETALAYLEQVTGAATEAVTEASADAIRLRRSLDTLPEGVVVCDENGSVVYRNPRANTLMTSRDGDVLAAKAVTELLEDAWHGGTAERTLDLYGPPRRTLAVRTRLIDDGRRPLGVIAVINDISERRRLEEIRRDFVANVSHELKTPIGALGLLAETLISESDATVAQRLASRIHTEAFRVSRIIDDLLDLSRIESEEAPPREPVLVNLVMAEAVERVRAAADQRGIVIELIEPSPPVAVHGDRRQLVSAMHALLENSVTYSYDSSKVTVAGYVADTAADIGTTRNGNRDTNGTNEQATTAAGTQPPPLTQLSAPVHPSLAELPTSPPSGSPQPPNLPPPPGSVGMPGPTDTTPLGVQTLSSFSPNVFVDPAAPGSPYARSQIQPSSDDPVPYDAEADGSDWALDAPTQVQVPADAQAPAPAQAQLPVPPVAASTGQPPRPEATVSSRSDSAPKDDSRTFVRLAVIDTGTGIPARDLDRIFERFYRVDLGRSRDTGGTGLGLSIARHVASNHQGWIEVESREGEGSTFTLVLPIQTRSSP